MSSPRIDKKKLDSTIHEPSTSPSVAGTTSRSCCSASSAPKSRCFQRGERDRGRREPREKDGEADQQSALEAEPAAEPIEAIVGGQEAFRNRVDTREQRKRRGLNAHDRERGRVHQRVDLEGRRADVDRSAEAQDRGEGQPDRRHRDPGDEEQPARAEQQQEAQMAPAVAPRAQVRRARLRPSGAASSGPRRSFRLGERGLDHHLAGELHAGGAQPEAAMDSVRGSRAGRNGSRRTGCGRTAGRCSDSTGLPR